MDMPAAIEILKRQESRLILKSFDEAVAWALGNAIRERAVTESLPICIDIVTWDRRLFFCTMPGASTANADWARRKLFTVKHRGRSSYRALLENRGEKLYHPNWGVNPADYALSGGAVPIAVKGAGVVGGIGISGLHEREDHQLGIDAICDHLKLDRKASGLPPE
jgi:uncharacterized protein (UPF0303 family)